MELRLLLLLTPILAYPSPGYLCRVRCASRALARGLAQGDDALTLPDCSRFEDNPAICSDEECWWTCGGTLPVPGPTPAPPANLTANYADGNLNPYSVELHWASVPNEFYLILSRDDNELFHPWSEGGRHRETTGVEPIQFDYGTERFSCHGLDYRVFAINQNGISSNYSAVHIQEPGKVMSDLKVWHLSDFNVTMKGAEYLPNQKFRGKSGNTVYDNASARVTLHFNPPKYILKKHLKFDVPLGFVPQDWFYVDKNQCSDTSPFTSVASQVMDTSRFAEGILELYMDGGSVRHQCHILIAFNYFYTTCQIESHNGPIVSTTNQKIDIDGDSPIRAIHFGCDTVENAPPCKKKYCGIDCDIKNMTVEVMDEYNNPVPLNDRQEVFKDQLANPDNLTVLIRWLDEQDRCNKPQDSNRLFYVVATGPAHALPQMSFLPTGMPGAEKGFVNFDLVKAMPDSWILCGPDAANDSTCANPDSRTLTPKIDKDGNTFLGLKLTGVKASALYGLQSCQVFNPDFSLEQYKAGFQQRHLSNGVGGQLVRQVIVKTIDRPMSGGEMALAIGLPLVVAFGVIVLVVLLLWRKLRIRKTQMKKLQEDQQRLAEERYSNMPTKGDEFELLRQRILIYDEKLGSGAFGAVFKGKVVGKLSTHKDSNSALATNLLRTENAEVAIKMLPEYADDLSKSDFLKEINLMKQLGYHERLVNLLACVTDSEPYLLVVEFCSDGDLLHFLRARCKYMMKLDEMGINYANPGDNDDFDGNMVLSLKELLGYALQISYGLEYLSTKGFIHRDVAARNVLIHQKRYAKLGDFGLCRSVSVDDSAYWGKGGRLPIKWMAPEAIKNYEFSTQTDVWSFGVLLFEIVTMGGSPYPGIQPADMEAFLEAGKRMEQPDNCPDEFYDVMMRCWDFFPDKRITFSDARQQLAAMLEEVTVDYSYLSLDARRDYYNVQYTESGGDPEAIESDNALNTARDVDELGFESDSVSKRDSLLELTDGSSISDSSDRDSIPPRPAPRAKTESVDSGNSVTPDNADRRFSFNNTRFKPPVRLPLATIHSDPDSETPTPTYPDDEEVSV